MPDLRLPKSVMKKYKLLNRKCRGVQLLEAPDPDGEFDVLLDCEITVESGNRQQVLVCTPEGKVIYAPRPQRGEPGDFSVGHYIRYRRRVLLEFGEKKRVLRKKHFLYVAAFHDDGRVWRDNRAMVAKQSRVLKVGATRRTAILKTEDSPRPRDRDGDDAVVKLRWLVKPRQGAQSARAAKRKTSARKK